MKILLNSSETKLVKEIKERFPKAFESATKSFNKVVEVREGDKGYTIFVKPAFIKDTVYMILNKVVPAYHMIKSAFKFMNLGAFGFEEFSDKWFPKEVPAPEDIKDVTKQSDDIMSDIEAQEIIQIRKELKIMHSSAEFLGRPKLAGRIRRVIDDCKVMVNTGRFTDCYTVAGLNAFRDATSKRISNVRKGQSMFKKDVYHVTNNVVVEEPVDKEAKELNKLIENFRDVRNQALILNKYSIALGCDKFINVCENRLHTGVYEDDHDISSLQMECGAKEAEIDYVKEELATRS